MSLVSSIIGTRNGKFYKNLVYRGDDWFICFDDNDPVELVIKLASTSSENPDFILKNLEWPSYKLSAQGTAGRIFNGKFARARSWFLLASPWSAYNEPFPTPREGDTFDEVFESLPTCEGVYYGCQIKT